MSQSHQCWAPEEHRRTAASLLGRAERTARTVRTESDEEERCNFHLCTRAHTHTLKTKRWANQIWPCSDMPAWGTRTMSQTSNLWGRWSADWTTVLRSHYAVKGRGQEVPHREGKKKKGQIAKCFYFAYWALCSSFSLQILQESICPETEGKGGKIIPSRYLFCVSAHQCGQIWSHNSQDCQRLMMFKEGE